MIVKRKRKNSMLSCKADFQNNAINSVYLNTVHFSGVTKKEEIKNIVSFAARVIIL